MTEPIRVLLVDDDPSYCKEMNERLPIADFEVVTATSGPEALARVKECDGNFDVAVIDQVMGPPNGTETMQMLRALYPELEVILLTAYPDEIERGLEAMELGAYRYLRKSFDANELALNIKLATRYNREHRQRLVLRSILDIGTAMQSAIETPDLLDKILQGIKALGYDRIRIYLLDRERNRLFGVAQVGGTKQLMTEVFLPLDEDEYSAHLVREGRPTIFKRGQYEDHYVEILDREGLDEWLELPLILDGVVIGKITVNAKFSRKRFTQEDLSDLALFAAPAASAIARSRRTQETQKSLQALVEAGHKIGIANTEEELYDLIWEQAQLLLPGTESILVTEYDEPNDIVSSFLYSAKGQRISLASRRHGKGVTEFVIRAGKAQLLPDGDAPFRKKHKLDPPAWQEAICASAIVVPMFLEGKVVGTINAHSYKPGVRYKLEHMEVLQAFANQVAVAIQHARQIKEAEDLMSATEALARRRGFEGTIQAIVANANGMINADLTGLTIQDRGGILRKVPPTEPPDYFERFEEPRQQGGVTRTVINARSPHVIFDTSNDPLVKESVRRAGVRSMLAMPLIFEDHVIGVLFAHTFELRYFSPYYINLLSAFAAQAAGALHVALEEEKNAIWQQLDQELARCDDLTVIYRLFVNHVHRALRADLVIFYPFDPTSPRDKQSQETECVLAGLLKQEWQSPQSGMSGGVYRQLASQVERLLIVNDLESQGEQIRSHFSKREQIKAFVGLRLDVVPEGQMQPRMAGMLFVNYREKTTFEHADLEGLLAAGDHVASAILRLRLQSALQKQAELRNEQLRAILGIFHSFRDRQDSQGLLMRIATAVQQTMNVDACSLLGYDQKTGEFSEYGAAGLNVPEYGFTAPKEFKPDFLDKLTPTPIPNILQYPLLWDSSFTQREGIVSAIVFPLWVEGQPLGLLFANYRTQKEFVADEIEGIRIFADLTAMVMHDRRLREELRQTQNRLESRTILTWVSMLEDTWRHALIQRASAIRNYIPVLRRHFGQLAQPPSPHIEETLEEIDRLAEEIAKAPVRVPQSWEMQPEFFPLAPLLQEVAQREGRISALKPSAPIKIETRVEGLAGVEIRGFRRWMIFALESLLQNARNAMTEGGIITIQGARNSDQVEVRIQDNGIGVPENIRGKLFKELIPKEEDKAGMGIGGLLVATIIEEHEGTIELERPGPGDTTVLIQLPVVRKV